MRLEINNSITTITDMGIETHNQLKRLLSYDPAPGSAYFGGFSRRQSLLTKKGTFPTGLLPKVEDFLSTKNVAYVRNDIRRAVIGSHYINGFRRTLTPHQYQLEAVEAAVVRHRGILSLPTGSGKSFVMALLVWTLQVKTLIVVPSVELKRQLQESFKEWFGVNDKITIENIDSPNLKKLNNFDCLIIDEAHHSAAKTYRNLNAKQWNGIYYRYFFTATPFRSATEEMMLFESVAGGLIYALSYEEAVKNQCIVPVEAYYYAVPEYRGESLGSSWASVYNKIVVKNHPRNLLITEILQNLASTGVSCLCLVKEIAHGNILSELTGIPFANGQDKDSTSLIKSYAKDEIRTLIATTGICGEGVDTKPCEFVVIAGLGKSKGHLMQQVGRGVRRFGSKESCKVLLFKDSSHIWPKKHFAAQVKILRDEYGTIPIEIKPLDKTD